MGTITNLEKRLERIERLTGINEPGPENVATCVVFMGPNGSPEDTESSTVGEDSARTANDRRRAPGFAS